MSHEPLDLRTEIQRAQLAGLGYRALATAHSLAAALSLAPTVVVKKALVEYVREELERFDLAALCYGEVVPGEDLHADVAPRLDEVPRPDSWLEVVVIQLLFDRAGAIQLEELAASGDARLARLAATILRGERMHAVMGAEAGAALRNMLHEDPDRRPAAQQHFERWLSVSLRSFGRPGTERSKQAIALGLKRRDSAEVTRDYLASLEPVIASCQLRVPSSSELGVELPAALPIA